MAADPMTGFDPDTDEDLKQANARFAAAGDQAKADAANDAFAKAAPAPQQQTSGLQHWFQDLPQNVGSGLITAAVNTADAMHSGLRFVDQKAKEAHEALTGESVDAQTRAEQGEAVDTPEYATVRNAVNDFKQKYVDVQNPDLADNITQGVAQFAIPFLGWSKAVSVVGGVGKLAAAGRTMLAEGATAGTVMAPHDGRFADMVELGKHTEGAFANALNAISPDGSLVNNYLNYMTADKENEGEFEGRAKNIVDTITGGAVISPLIHAGFGMLKGGMAGLKYAMENGVGSIDQLGVPNQAGRIGYHGTPHDFNTEAGFDNSKIGSGEGAQVYGYGHYLAEAPEVAGQYQQKLSAKVGGAVQDAQQAIAKYGDSVKAYKAYSASLANETDPAMRSRLQGTMNMLKNGNATRGSGSLITADIPDEHVANMIDHDKLMSDQPGVLNKIPKADRTQLQKVLDDHNQDVDLSELTGGQFRQVVERAINEGYLDHPSLDPMDSNAPRQASQYLDSQGIPGIKYLDGKSRGGGEGTRNIVLFDGKKANVIAKNGKPVTK